MTIARLIEGRICCEAKSNTVEASLKDPGATFPIGNIVADSSINSLVPCR